MVYVPQSITAREERRSFHHWNGASEESPPSFPVIPRSVKGFMNRFNAGESSFEEKRTPARWGQRARVGVLPEGGPEEIQSRFSASPLLLGWPARKSAAILRR